MSADLRIDLAVKLLEWRDAGGPVEDVVWAIEDLVKELLKSEPMNIPVLPAPAV